MKKTISILFLCILGSFSVFADIVMPHTGFVIRGISDAYEWIEDDRTEFSKKKAMGIIDVPNPVMNRVYLTPKEDIGKPGKYFALVNECTGMNFIFSWSAVRVMAIRESRNEMKRFYKMHVESLEGSKLKIRSEKSDNKTGEFYIRYTWTMKDGTLVNGYTASTFFDKETLVTVTLEWTDKEGKEEAKRIFKQFKEDVSLKFDIHI